MTSGRDEAKKRRGRGKADDGPSEAELGWLAELRNAREDDGDLDGAAETPVAGRPGPDVSPPRRVAREERPARAAREEPLEVPPRRQPWEAEPEVPPRQPTKNATPPRGPVLHGPVPYGPVRPGQHEVPPPRAPASGRLSGARGSSVRGSGARGVEAASTTQLTPLAQAVKRQLRQVSWLRTATFTFLVLAVIGAPAAFFVIREFTRDPVFVELDNLDVPRWAAGKHTDGALGSRWCIRECRSRQRTSESARGPEETNRAYVAALKRSGWVVWDIPDCQAEGIDGIETCWQRDEYVLDLWVRAAVCEGKGVRPTVAPPSPTVRTSGKTTVPAKPPGSAAPPPALPSAGPAASPANICPGAIVSIKVYNRISYRPGG